MATYTPVDKRTPSSQRTALITSVVATDEIDFRAILGRAARGIKVVADSGTDVVEYRLISYAEKRIRKAPTAGLNSVYEHSGVNSQDWTVSEVGLYSDVFSNTGAEFTLESGLAVEGIVIDSLTGPSDVEIVIW